jgi:hypothetical protein
VSLTCRSVSGSPEPQLVWERVDGGELSGQLRGSVLSWSAVTREAAGHYACLADNGFGPGIVRQEIHLQILCKLVLCYKTAYILKA